MLNIGLPDHLPVCAVRKYTKHNSNPNHSTITYRKWKTFDEEAFLGDLDIIPWDNIDMCDNPDDAVEFFEKSRLDIVNTRVPLIHKKGK